MMNVHIEYTYADDWNAIFADGGPLGSVLLAEPDRHLHQFCWCEICGEFDCMHAFCDRHGWTMIDGPFSYQGPGYAGGMIYATTLLCGCTDLNEDADLRAAF